MRYIALAAALLAAIPATADAREGTQVRVRYSDLNLSTDAGIRRFDRRLAQAVRAVCRDDYSPTDIVRRIAVRPCVESTSTAARAERDRVLAALPARTTLANGR